MPERPTPSHALPAEPDAPVIEWSTSGGLGGGGNGPDLTVRADGRVELSERFGGGRRVEDRIPEPRLQSLLRSVVDEHRFFALDPAAIEAEVADRRPSGGAGEALAVPLGPPYADAGTTRIAVAADGRRHEVAYHGLFAAAREHPDVRDLADLRAVEHELLGLAEEIARR